MLLFINACVRKESRTKRLADSFLAKLNKSFKEIRLQEIELPFVDEAFIKRRDRLIMEQDFSNSMFDLARQFAEADDIVIAAPFWDLSFPAVLKQYFEQINVLGITFLYTPEGVPKGLCRARSLTYITTAGGNDVPKEYGFGYVKALAHNFYDIPEVRLIKAAGLDIIGADTEAILQAASASASSDIIANEEPDTAKIARARRIIAGLQHDLEGYTAEGSGPFVAAVYDGEGNLVAKMPNTVVSDKCSHNHAEMNVIKAAEEKLGTHDLISFNMKLYCTSEPCAMCLGGIMWSGIKEVYYGVPTDSVEKITGFDEGCKSGWLDYFKKCGIVVYGNIERELGEQALRNYMAKGGTIYQPRR